MSEKQARARRTKLEKVQLLVRTMAPEEINAFQNWMLSWMAEVAKQLTAHQQRKPQP